MNGVYSLNSTLLELEFNLFAVFSLMKTLTFLGTDLAEGERTEQMLSLLRKGLGCRNS